MKRSPRWSPWIAGLLVAGVALGVPWQSFAQTKKAPSGFTAKKPSTAKAPAGPASPAKKAVPGKTAAGAVPTKPDPATEVLEKLPPEVQDPLIFAAPSKPEPPGPLGPYRPMAPGVMRVITPDRNPEDGVSVHDVLELQQFEWAKGIPFRRDVWALEFRFKPVRILDVDVPQPSGKMQRKPIWYLLYSVTNRGKVMQQVQQPDGTFKLAFDDKVTEPVAQPDGTLTPQPVDKPIFFAPQFLLASANTGKRYPDRVIPVAMAAIRFREDRNRQFYNSVEIVRELNRGETVWGIATWEDIDPKTEQFSVYVAGLTNAYAWDDQPGALQKDDPLGKGRQLWRRTLKLNFWRPGNERDVEESQVRFGIPGQPDHVWTYCDATLRERPQPAPAAAPPGVANGGVPNK